MKLSRMYAPSIGKQAVGTPLVRSTSNLGWQLVRIKGTVDVESDLKPETKKKRVYWGFKRFKEWMEKEGHQYKGNLVIHGPFPHMDFKEPSIQRGDRGGERMIARSIADDLHNNGKEDYVLEAHFLVREYVQEVPSDVALNVIGQRGIRAADERTQQG